MSAAAIQLNLTAEDTSGHNRVTLASVPRDATVGQLLQRVMARLGVVDRDRDGRPIHFGARLEREGRLLNDSELAADALQPDDKISLQPRINAG